jgi:hypothetical protein
MSKTRYFEADSQCEEITRRLEEDLYLARRTIIQLMPDNVQEIMNAYYSCRSRQELYRWEYDAVEEIIKLANILSAEEGSRFSDRAYCPLCGEGTSSAYERGFSVPEGLRRHLVGQGNIQQCGVMQAAERVEEAEKREKLAQRKKSEVLYRTAPDLEPELIDERFSSGGNSRSTKELDWVEERLASLGFQITCDASVESYTNEHGDFVVYADPRQRGRVDFNVFPKDYKRSRDRLRLGWASFYMLDGWKKELREKYEVRVENAISQLKKRQ